MPYNGAASQETGLDGAVCSPKKWNSCGRRGMTFCLSVQVYDRVGQLREIRRDLSSASKAGADYLVIGRPITAASNPESAWERICDELAAVL